MTHPPVDTWSGELNSLLNPAIIKNENESPIKNKDNQGLFVVHREKGKENMIALKDCLKFH